MTVSIYVDRDARRLPDAAAVLAMIAALKLAGDCMKQLGMTKELAVERAGVIVAATWDDPQILNVASHKS